MAVNLSAMAGAAVQFFDANGNPLSGGKLTSYAAGTTTPKTTYTDAAGTTAHSNPIILDAAGRISTGEIWLTAGENYKFVLSSATNVLIGTYDNITGINGTGISSSATNVSFTGFKGQTGVVQDLADSDGSDWLGYVTSGTGSTARSVQDRLRDTLSVKDFGAVGNGVADDTIPIKNAISYCRSNPSIALFFPRGDYKITDTLDLTLCVGLNMVGDSWGYFGGNGTRLVWYGGNVKPMIFGDFTKGGSIQNFTFKCNNLTTDRAFACLQFGKGTSTGSSGMIMVSRCIFDDAQYGMYFGSAGYNNTWNVSEMYVVNSIFDRYLDCGVFNIGVPTGSQMVNNVFFVCHFNCLRGVWLDGGNVILDKCTFQGANNAGPMTCLYITGDRSLTQPTVLRDCYSENVCKVVETEFTSSSGEWFRSGKLILESGYFRCNKPAGATPYIVECYKAMDIEIRGVTHFGSSGVLYSPPADAAGATYSATAPSDAKLTLYGSMDFGALTCSRGGYVISNNPLYVSNVTAGTVFPNTTTGTLTVSPYISNLHEYVHYASTGGVNGTFDISTISGGQINDVLHLYASPTLVATRNWLVKNNVGNIYTKDGADFAINTATKKIILQCDPFGKWVEIGRISN